MSITSVLIPKSFCAIPLCVAEISPLSSTTPTVNPSKLYFGIPLLICLTKSLNTVVFPAPGGETINVLLIVLFLISKI